jgi:hypothetical protein
MEFDWKRDISLDPKALDLRAGDGDRTRDVQLGKLAFGKEQAHDDLR